MIRQRDLYLNYLVFYVQSIICVLPIQFNRETHRIRIIREGPRRWIWSIWFLQGFIYAAFKDIRLMQALMFSGGKKSEPQHISFHIIMAGTFTNFSYWSILIFIQNPGVNEVLFNQIFVRNEDNALNAKPKPDHLERRGYSTQEWLILFLPIMFLVLYPTVYTTLHIVDPTAPEYFYSVLPKSYQTNKIRTFFVLYDLAIFLSHFSVGIYGTVVQLAFIQNTNDLIGQLINDAMTNGHDWTWARLLKECKMLRMITLVMQLFNGAYSNVIFAYKLLLISDSTTFIYAAISFTEHPAYVAVFTACAITVPPLYIIVYDKGFSIPPMIGQWQEQILLVANDRLRFTMNKDYVKKRIHSVPELGIKVGRFHTLERLSSPIFINFVINQVVSILVAFPKGRN